MASQLRALAISLISTIIWTKGFAGVSITMKGLYISESCNMNVTCHAGTSDFEWDIKGSSLPTTDIRHIPGITLKGMEKMNGGRYQQTLVIRRGYNRVTITCRDNRSYARLTLFYGGYDLRENTTTLLTTGEIVGIVIGVAILIGGIVAVIIICKRKKRTSGVVVQTFNNPIGR